MVTAYVPATEPDPGAQLALRMIIERETTASLPQKIEKPKRDPALDPLRSAPPRSAAIRSTRSRACSM